MSLSIEQLAEEAMRLPVELRAELAGQLVESLDDSNAEPDIDKEWLTEAVRRLEEVRSGAVRPIPADEVFREMEKIAGA